MKKKQINMEENEIRLLSHITNQDNSPYGLIHSRLGETVPAFGDRFSKIVGNPSNLSIE